jgi:hypothetical protein
MLGKFYKKQIAKMNKAERAELFVAACAAMPAVGGYSAEAIKFALDVHALIKKASK